jgi:hypothetical protein
VGTNEVDRYFIVTTAAKERSEYASQVDANTALQGLLELQLARGYENERNPSGRFMSKHPDKPLVIFWIENAKGKIVS